MWAVLKVAWMGETMFAMWRRVQWGLAAQPGPCCKDKALLRYWALEQSCSLKINHCSSVILKQHCCFVNEEELLFLMIWLEMISEASCEQSRLFQICHLNLTHSCASCYWVTCWHGLEIATHTTWPQFTCVLSSLSVYPKLNPTVFSLLDYEKYL